VDILRILVDSDLSKLNPQGLKKAQYHLVEACRSGSFFSVQFFVSECGLDPFKLENSHRKLRQEETSKQDWTELRGPFYSAIFEGHKSTTQYLLSLQDDQHFLQPEEQEDLLKVAAASGLEDIVEMLINHQFDADNIMAKEYTTKASLVKAVRYGKEELVTELLPLAVPDYDVPDHNGCFTLMYAALNGLEHPVEYLLQKEADVNRLGHCPEVTTNTTLGKAALLLATSNGHLHIVRRLLECPNVSVSSGLISWG
jgi:Ankyrin repeats (3 copies)